MKRIVWIGILFLLALTACDGTTHEARRMVKCAEQLADTLPDSAARLIDSVLRMPASFSERERMDMALLQAEALFGERGQEISPVMDDDFFDEHAYISTSPELERAAVYYAKKKQYAKAAHAALYSGFVQQHYDEKEAAMRSFKEAERYGKMVCDSLTVARAEYRMGKMLYHQGIEKEALSSLKISEKLIGNRNADRAIIENSKAVVYLLMNQNDSAELCLQQSEILAKKGNYGRISCRLCNNYSVLYRLEGKYDEAIAALQQMVDDSNLDDTERLLLYLNISNVYFSTKEMDSAIKYYERIETLLPTVNPNKETQATAYEALSHYAEALDNNTLALQYREKHERILYELMLQRQEQTIYRIQRQFDLESFQNEMNKKIIKRHVAILIMSILLLIATLIALVLQYRQKRLLELEEEMKRQMDAMKQNLSQTVKFSVLDQEVSSRLRMILTAFDRAQRAKDPQKEWQSLARQVMNGKDNPFDAARSVLEMVYPHLFSTIKENYPDLTETEAKICLLSCSDLSNQEIADFLGLKPNTVNQNRSNLRKKLNLKPERMKEQLQSVFSE